MYILWPASSFIIVIFTTNSTLRRNPTMFGLNMCIKCRIGKIAQFTTPTSILSTLFIIPSFPSLFLFLLHSLRILRIIFNIKIMQHVHCLHCTMIDHFSFTLIVLLSNREKLSIVLLLGKTWLLLACYY